MADTHPAQTPLDAATNARRLELDLTWKQVAERAGMTEFHLQRIRAGKVRLTERAASKIDRALEWEHGSTQDALDGGEPRPLRRDRLTAGSPPIPEGLNIDPKKWARWDPIDRENIINAVKLAEQRQRAADAAAQSGPERQRPRGA